MVEAEGGNLFEYFSLAGVFVGGVVAAMFGYRKRPGRPVSEVAVASVGLELGNRHQIEAQIAATEHVATAINRVGDILENKKQAGMERKLDELLHRIDEIEEDHHRDEKETRRRS